MRSHLGQLGGDDVTMFVGPMTFAVHDTREAGQRAKWLVEGVMIASTALKLLGLLDEVRHARLSGVEMAHGTLCDH